VWGKLSTHPANLFFCVVENPMNDLQETPETSQHTDSSRKHISSLIGLSHVHITQGENRAKLGHVPADFVIFRGLRGVQRDEGERAHCDGGPVAFVHPTGPGSIGDPGDHWISVRRWRDGISIGAGPVLDHGGDVRGDVTEFSDSSGRRMVQYLREASARYLYMGTLTVGADWDRDPARFRSAVDGWLCWFLRAQRAAAQSGGGSELDCSIFWFIEFQSRGAPHLHLFYTNYLPWEPSARKWAELCLREGLCGEGEVEYFWRTSTRFETIRSGFGGMLRYARKYAVKVEQKQVPEGVFSGGWQGRFWGVRGSRKRGSFHLAATGRTGCLVAVRDLESWLDECERKGLVRKVPWSRGSGATYVPRGCSEWTESEMGVELEIRLMRLSLSMASLGHVVDEGR